MGDASNSGTSKGKGGIGGFFRRFTGGGDSNKETAPRTGVTLKDRFSKLKPNAVPTDAPHRQRTLDEIPSHEDNDVKVIHTSAARSTRFSDRVGIGIGAGTDAFERTISFDKSDDDDEYEETASESAYDRNRGVAGRYAGNKIVFENDAAEKKEPINNYGPIYRHEGNEAEDTAVEVTACVADANGIADIHEDKAAAPRTALAERLRARQARMPEIRTDEPVRHVAETPSANETPEDITICETDAEPEATYVSDTAEDISVIEEDILIPIITDAEPADIVKVTTIDSEDTEIASAFEILETCIAGTDAEDSINDEVCIEFTDIAAECKALPCTADHLLLSAPSVIDETCDIDACEETSADAVCDIRNAVNYALNEIENDTPCDETCDTDTDDAEQAILEIIGGAITEGMTLEVRTEEPAQYVTEVHAANEAAEDIEEHVCGTDAETVIFGISDTTEYDLGIQTLAGIACYMDNEPETEFNAEDIQPDAASDDISGIEEDILIPIITDAEQIGPMEITDIDSGNTEIASAFEIFETCAIGTDAQDEIIDEVCIERTDIVSECEALPCAIDHLLLYAAAVASVIDGACDIDACKETSADAVCDIPNTVNDALNEIEDDTPCDEARDTDTDDAEREILYIMRGVVVDGAIVPAEDIQISEPLETVAEEDDIHVPYSEYTQHSNITEDAASDDVSIAESSDIPSDHVHRVCFSFLSEESTSSSAEVRFVWG